MVYKRNKKWKQSVELSKKDKMYKDAMETVSESEDKDLAEELLRFFVDNGLQECFAACLYTCYDLMRPDVALELAWRNKIFDFAMPYIIQLTKEFVDKINEIAEKVEKKEEAGQAAHVDPMMAMHMNVVPQQIGWVPQPPMGGMPTAPMGGGYPMGSGW
jgi:clathrin heavy chain